MKSKLSFVFLTILLFIGIIFLGACGTPTPTAVPLLPSPTPIPPTPTTPPFNAHNYFNLAVGNQWQYHLEISPGMPVIFDPFFIKPEGAIATSATNGSGTMKYTARDFSITVTDMVSDIVAKVEISDLSGIPWVPLDVKEATLVLVTKENGDLSFEIHIVPDLGGDWELGQLLAVIPAGTDASSVVDLQTPAGDFSTLHLIMAHREVMNYTYAYTQETWLAEGIGMVKSITSNKNNDLIYTLELTGYTVK